jgi:hypothetical protein
LVAVVILNFLCVVEDSILADFSGLSRLIFCAVWFPLLFLDSINVLSQEFNPTSTPIFCGVICGGPATKGKHLLTAQLVASSDRPEYQGFP